jgi:diadenylate cyclase
MKNMPAQKLGFWESIVEFISDFVIFPLVNINLVNILDILLLSFLIYIVYKFIRDRHAGRTLIGFGLIMLLYILSDILGMVAINSILKNFYAVGIIALCVLFQPELREVLAEFGTTTSLNFRRITNRHTVDDDNVLHAIEEISAAAFDLSSRREGALIVLERTSRLRNQMTEGTPVDAVVSRQLLCNIFVNRSPLHDGAVIIRDCRIVSASNKSKTISEDADLVEGLGTRHRAALKISEISDAVVLIVSEETGTISIANNKLLKRHYDDIGKGGRHKSTDLRDDLFKLMTGKSVNDMLIDRITKTVSEKAQNGKKSKKQNEGKENGTNETV